MTKVDFISTTFSVENDNDVVDDVVDVGSRQLVTKVLHRFCLESADWPVDVRFISNCEDDDRRTTT